MGYTPVGPPCYPVAPSYYHPTPAAPASRLPRMAIHAAYPAAHQPQTAVTLPRREPTRPGLKEPQECGDESPVEERECSSSPPIDLLATVLLDVGEGQIERKGGPCTLAVGSVISALRLVAPSVDLDAVATAAEGCKSSCGNGLRLGKGLCAASGMLKRGGSAVEAVARYVVSSIATNCCQRNCQVKPLTPSALDRASTPLRSPRPALLRDTAAQSLSAPSSVRHPASSDRGRQPASGLQRASRKDASPSRGTRGVSGLSGHLAHRHQAQVALPDNALAWEHLSHHDTSALTSVGLSERVLLSSRVMDTCTAWLTRETADTRHRTALHLPSWVGSARDERRAVEFLCAAFQSRRDPRVPCWFSAGLLVAPIRHGGRWLAVVIAGLGLDLPMLSNVEEGHHRRDKHTWASSLRVLDPCRRPNDSTSADSCVSFLFRVLSKAISRGFVEHGKEEDNARVVEKSLLRYVTVAPMQLPDRPRVDGGCMLISFLCFLTCSSPQHARKLLQDATELDWTGVRSPGAVACSILDLVQAKKRSSAENLRRAAAARRLLLSGGPWCSGEDTSDASAMMKTPLSVGAAVTPYAGAVTDPSLAVQLVDGGRARTTATARTPNKEPNASPGDALSSLGARLKRLKPILEAGRRDSSAAVRDHEYDWRDSTPDQRGSAGPALVEGGASRRRTRDRSAATSIGREHDADASGATCRDEGAPLRRRRGGDDDDCDVNGGHDDAERDADARGAPCLTKEQRVADGAMEMTMTGT